VNFIEHRNHVLVLLIVLTDRLVPGTAVYVPRLKAAFGFSCIDIVLQYTVDEDNVRRSNALLGTVSESKVVSCCKSDGVETNLYSRNMESNCKNQRSDGRYDRIENAKCGNNDTTGNSTKTFLNSDRFRVPSLKVTDCDGVSVKLEFNDENQRGSILTNVIKVYNETKSHIVQIFFKAICVKSSFANQITCLLATEMTEYVVLRYPNVNPHEVRTFGSTSHVVFRFPPLPRPLAHRCRHHNGSAGLVILVYPRLDENA
jgi:hypothetical protein